MLATWRVIDTGLGPPARNVALNRALLEARDADEIPSTLQFLRYAPSALLGCNQSPAQELDVAYCVKHLVPIQRRITGGTARYVDERQLGWALYLHRRDVGAADMQTISRRIGHAAATALSALGVDARYRSRDEIEVDGLAVCATDHAAEGDGVLFQALLLVDADVERMMRVLRMPRVPEAAVTPAGLRLAGLKDILGRQPDLQLVRRNLAAAFESEFDVEFREGDPDLSEHSRYQRALREIETAGWVDFVSSPASDMPLLEAVHAFPGGVLRAALKYEASSSTIRQVRFSGDIVLQPHRVIADLEAALRDVPMSRFARRIESFFAGRPGSRGAPEPHDFVRVVRLAIGQPLAA